MERGVTDVGVENGVGIEGSMKRLADKSRGAAPWLRAHVSQISKLDSSTN